MDVTNPQNSLRYCFSMEIIKRKCNSRLRFKYLNKAVVVMSVKYVFLFLLLATVAFSASSCPDLIKKYGNKIALPSTVVSLFSGSTVKLVVSTSSGTVTANGKIQNSGIEKIVCGSATADYTVSLDEKSVSTLSKVSSSARTSTFISMMKKGEIKLSASGYMASLKLKFALMLLGG